MFGIVALNECKTTIQINETELNIFLYDIQASLGTELLWRGLTTALAADVTQHV